MVVSIFLFLNILGYYLNRMWNYELCTLKINTVEDLDVFIYSLTCVVDKQSYL